MPYIAKNQGSLAAALAPKNSHCVQAWDGSEDKPDSLKIQELRSAWLVRRARISNAMAAVLAPLVLGEEAQS